MQVERLDGRITEHKDLTLDELLARTQEELKDPDVTKITITPNRHERRRQAAIARRRKPVKES